MQEELEVKQYEAAAGGGVVKAVVNGKHEVVSLTIDPEAVDPEDVEMLQDMVVAAVNEAMRKAEAEAQAIDRITEAVGKTTNPANYLWPRTTSP